MEGFVGFLGPLRLDIAMRLSFLTIGYCKLDRGIVMSHAVVVKVVVVNFGTKSVNLKTL